MIKSVQGNSKIKTMKNVYFSMVFAIFFLLNCNQAPMNWDEYKTSFADNFKDGLKRENVVGAGYAIFDDKGVIWQDSYGFANKTTHEHTSFTTKFLIGSVTKVFTAVAILQLHEKGILHIDSCVSFYLPEFAINQRFKTSKPITIRDVLTHHAGLPSDIFLHKFAEKPPYFSEILNYLNHQSTCFPAGEIKSYSNIGYALLGILIERASGVTYPSYIEKNILSPLGMENSGFYLSTEIKNKISSAYNIESKESVELPIFDVPAGAIYSTVEDMSKFGKSFLNKENPILKPETIELMFEIQNKEIQLDLLDKSAICFNLKNKAGELGRVLEHGGATLYHRAEFYIAPDAKIGGIMLSNSPQGVKNAWKLNEQFMVEYTKKHAIGIEPNTIPKKHFNFTSIKDKNLKSYVGDYVMPGMNCEFQWKHDNIYATVQSNSFYLLPKDDHSFAAAKRYLGIMFKSKDYHFFLEEVNGEKLFIQAMPWGDLSIIGNQIIKKPIPPNWEQRIGKYEITNLSAGEVQMIKDIEIIQKNGLLVLKYTANAFANTADATEMTLDIMDNSTAFTMGLGRGGGEGVVFNYDDASKSERFEYYGLKCKMIKANDLSAEH